MCPSYVFTQDEMHTTRGRARLLFEMLEGELVADGWRSSEVKEALDLCLACKGCTNDCPVNVDMPTYKAEFLHHHWKRRLRPRHAYAFGLVDQAARVASRVPGLVNALSGTPLFSRAFKLAAGMAPERDVPAFAPLTLQAWMRGREGRNQDGPRVVLWPDTFNNHFHTDVGVAAVEALEAAGWHVVVPEGHVCCGRPLYDYGFLTLARRYLHRTLDVLRDEIRAGTPVVGIEPSCLATFKDELVKLLPHDDDAARFAGQAFHFGEFLAEHDVELPRLRGEAILWGHCHHKATGGINPEADALRRLGLKVREVTGGCCGLAGSWGFEAGHHEHSMEAGEHALLPAVRGAGAETLVVANGFSCKTQIAQGGTGRRALHLAQVLELARNGRDPGAYPERGVAGRPPAPRSLRIARGAALAALATVAALAARKAVS
jgi:Fe-S oxidoreductase